MTRLVFLPELNGRTGYGHFYRCVAMMQMLEHDFDALICVHKRFKKMSPWPNKTLSYEVEYPGISEIMGYFNPEQDILVTDGYGIKLSFREELKRLGFRLIRIDDFPGVVVSDLYINQSNSVEFADYSFEDSRLLLGTDYALLRREYLQRAKMEAQAPASQFKRVSVMFGGSDPFNLGEYFSKELQGIDEVEEIVLLGNYDHHREAKVERIGGLDAENLIKLIEGVDLVICAASTFFLEVCCIGKPCLLGIFGDDQKNFANDAVSSASAQYMLDLREDKPDILDCFEKVRSKAKELVNNQKKLIDGNQAERIRKAVYDLSA